MTGSSGKASCSLSSIGAGNKTGRQQLCIALLQRLALLSAFLDNLYSFTTALRAA